MTIPITTADVIDAIVASKTAALAVCVAFGVAIWAIRSAKLLRDDVPDTSEGWHYRLANSDDFGEDGEFDNDHGRTIHLTCQQCGVNSIDDRDLFVDDYGDEGWGMQECPQCGGPLDDGS